MSSLCLKVYFKRKKEINASRTYSPRGMHAAKAKNKIKLGILNFSENKTYTINRKRWIT